MAAKLAVNNVFENHELVSLIVNFMPDDAARMELYTLSTAFKAAVHRHVYISKGCASPSALIALTGSDLITLTIDRGIEICDSDCVDIRRDTCDASCVIHHLQLGRCVNLEVLRMRGYHCAPSSFERLQQLCPNLRTTLDREYGTWDGDRNCLIEAPLC